jgi:hypothetical protein
MYSWEEFEKKWLEKFWRICRDPFHDVTQYGTSRIQPFPDPTERLLVLHG